MLLIEIIWKEFLIISGCKLLRYLNKDFSLFILFIYNKFFVVFVLVEIVLEVYFFFGV